MCLRHIPLPDRNQISNFPSGTTYGRLIFITIGRLLCFLWSILISFWKVFIPFLPAVESNKGRHLVFCRVHASGVNPCDAKMLYGDKVCASTVAVLL